MNAMDSLCVAVETIAAGLVQNYDDILANEGCADVPPVDYDIADSLQYNTEITGMQTIR